MTDACRYCQGIGYDASGQRCTCNDTPIQYVPPSTWRIALERIAKFALYVCCVAVIIGPTVIMVAYSKPDDAGCKPAKPVKLVLYPRQTP